MNTKDNKEATIIFRTSQETKSKLEALAAKDSRTLSNYLNLLIEKALSKKP
jgi:predicted DNA-binding protein